ncbi:MAG: lysophospholipid acyltransferase family protein [Acidimicrobiales bacterium]
MTDPKTHPQNGIQRQKSATKGIVVRVPTRRDALVYEGVRRAVDAINRTLWHTVVTYEAPLPERPYILAPTHRSYIDTILVGSVTKTYLHYMAKAELWKSRPFGRFLEILGGFPVDRDAADREALKSALSVLEIGEGLVLFPEGERRDGDIVHDLHDGAAYLALRASVPIVPVAFYGSAQALGKGAKLPRSARVRAVVGPSLLPQDYVSAERRSSKTVSRASVTRLTEALTQELQRLYDKAATL